MMSYVLLLVGFVLLIKGADYFVEGSSSVAKLLKVPSVIIGLTIVAMGTSAPEAAVSITAGLNGSNAIALGNVVGSNLFNILLVLGASCAISPIAVAMESVIDIAVSIAVHLLMLAFCASGKEIKRGEGLIAVAVYFAYMVSLFMR